MRKTFIMTVGTVLLLSSCGTYTGSGAYTGSGLGAILGSAIGGLSDSPRGSDIGTIIGMVGGAVIGGAIGNQADKKREADMDQYQKDRAEREAQRQEQQAQDDAYLDSTQSYEQSGREESGFDSSNSSDDRIYDFNGSDYNGSYSAQQPTTNLPQNSDIEGTMGHLSYNPDLEIRRARFVDDNQDGTLNAGEVSKLIFEVHNRGKQTVFDVVPTVVETTGNRHIWISPSIHIEKIAPGKGIRYTAIVKADNKLRNGKAQFCVSVVQGNEAISKITEFNILTKK